MKKIYCLAFLSLSLLPPNTSWPATPTSGTITRPGTLTANWSGGPFTGVTDDPLAARCNNSQCDNYQLTVGTINDGDQVTIHIDWLNPANDFDLYIFDANGTQVTSSGASAPGTSEEATFSVTANTAYSVSVLIYTVINDSYTAGATLHAGPIPRTPGYAIGNFTFSPNVTIAAPATVANAEPSIRVDSRGNAYCGGPGALGNGDDVWRTNVLTDPCAANWTYIGAPDAVAKGASAGGGDIELAVGFPNDNSLPLLTVSGLSGANITMCNSTDRGQSFFCNFAAASVPGDDRQWQEMYGKDTVIMFYRAPGALVIGLTGLFAAKSIDGGRTWLPSSFVGIGSTPGYIAIDQRDGTIYLIHGSSSALFVSRSKNAIQWSTVTVANTNPRNLFPVVKVDRAGNVYALWSEGHNILLSVSTDQAETWGAPVQVNNPADPNTKTNVMPWMEAGDAGRLDIVWYGTDQTGPSSELLHTADWHVYFAQTLNALDPNITFAQARVSDHILHHGNICLSGTGCDDVGGNRNLLDYFQVAVDPTGAAVIAYSDDHNDYLGNIYVTRQTSGSSVLAASPTVPTVTGCSPPPFHTDPEVTDFAPDAAVSAVDVPADAMDIVDIDYGDEIDGSDLYLFAKMKILDLTTPLPPNIHWRCYLAFAHDIADKGKENFMEFNTDLGVQSFKYGNVARNNDGTYTETQVGDLDGSSITLTKPGVIKLRIRANRLAKPDGAPPAVGDTVIGLKGRTYVDGSQTTARFDRTRGGTAFIIGTRGGGGGIFIGCDDPAVASSGGWHGVADSRATNGTYCRNVGATKGNSGAYLQFQFHGTGIEMDIARGPRGGNAEVLIDGTSRGKVEFYRAPSNPSKPDNSGQKDLTFGIKLTYSTTPGSHTFRLNVLNDDTDAKRDMAYVDDFIVEGGDVGGSGSPVDLSALSTGTAGVLGTVSQVVSATSGTQLVTAVLDVPEGADQDLRVLNANGLTLDQSTGNNATEVVQFVPSSTGTFTIQVINKTLNVCPYSLYVIRTQQGAGTKTRIVKQPGSERPSSFALEQNYPNPFNPVTVIRYSLPVNSYVTLKVYDVLGQEVAALLDEERPAGSHTAAFDASRLSSGVYMYKLAARPTNGGQARQADGGQAGSFVDAKRMIIIK